MNRINNLHFGDFDGLSGIGASLYLGDFWPGDTNTGILVFRGMESPLNIDYYNPVGGRRGSGDVVITGFNHVIETDYFYAARQVSIFGRMEENITKITRFRLLADGTWEGNVPDHVMNLSAKTKSAGTIEVSWSHVVLSGAKPVQYNVYYDKGLGPANINTSDPDCLLGHADYGFNKYITAALTSGVTYYFSVQAESASGGEDKFIAVTSAMADSNGPAHLEGVECVTRL